MAALDHSISEYNTALEAKRQGGGGSAETPPSAEDIAQKLAALRQRERRRGDLAKLRKAATARFRAPPGRPAVAKHGQSSPANNVQIAVDDKHNADRRQRRGERGHDTGQLYAMAQAAKAALGVAALTAVAALATIKWRDAEGVRE